MKYIKPNIKIYNSIKELSESSNESYFFFEKTEFDKIYDLKQFFVVSEPGFGKSRCLKELALNSCIDGGIGIFVDLKKINIGQTIEDFINNVDQILNKSENVDNIKNSFKTDNSKLLNSKKIIVCLDALDEVKGDNFSAVVSELKLFISKFNNVKICISCRKNYILNWKNWFLDLDFRYVKINLFDPEQTVDYLISSGVEDSNAKEIVDVVRVGGRYSIIQIPRYLEILLDISSKSGSSGLSKLATLSKGELFDIFIDKKIDLEVEKTENRDSQKELIKSVLGKLALIMEIYQTNSIKKEELMIFFDDIKSNLSAIALSQVSLEHLYARTIVRDNINEIEFENTEFQEYLAAKEIANLGRTDQIVFDLILDKEARDIKQSWLHTLSFLVDIDISILKNILFYILKEPGSVNIENYHRLLTKYNVEKLAPSDRSYIFSSVFSYYQTVKHWIDLDICSNLSFYCDKSDLNLIFEFYDKADDDDEVVKSNSVLMIGELLDRNLLNNNLKNKWKLTIKKNITGDDKFEVLQRRSIIALGKFKDLKLLDSIRDKVFKSGKDLIINNITYAYQEVDSESKGALFCFIEGTRRNNISARHALHDIKGKNNIKLFIKFLFDNNDFLQEFLDHESIYNDLNDKFLSNIDSIIDTSILRVIDNLIFKSFISNDFWYRSRGSKFLLGLTKILEKRIDGYLFKLIEKISSIGDLDEVKKYLYNFQEIFVQLLKKGQVSNFINKLKEIGSDDWFIVQILGNINYSGRGDAKIIYEEGRPFFPEEYKKFDSSSKKVAPDNKKAAHKEFIFKLEPEKGKYVTDVFKFYLDNKENFRDLVTQTEKERLIKLVKFVLAINPGEQKLKITKKSDDGSSLSYTTSSLIFQFGHCLRILDDLGISTNVYRQKILNYIPFAYDKDREAIFSLIKNPTEKELKNFLSIYTNKKLGDIKDFNPSSLIEASVHYNIKLALPILKKYVGRKIFSNYDRISALQAIAKLSSFRDKKYFISIFNSNIKRNNWLSVAANECLINIFKDEKAIKWRLNQLVESAFPFKRIYNGVHDVDRNEAEIDEKTFAKPIMDLNSDKYEKLFLNLLSKSFEIYNKGEEYSEYSNYLWGIIIQYYKNLKQYSSYRYLDNLEKFILSNKVTKGVNWFSYKYQDLKIEYMIELGKPKNISDCIKKYNKIKENIYADVYNEKELFELIKNIIDNDLRRWVEKDGAYKKIKDAGRTQEKLIQSTIKSQLDCFLSKHLRGVDIKREVELMGGEKIDFLVSYGFYGPICLEIKLTYNTGDIGSINSMRKYRKNKLLKYIEGFNSNYCVFLVFNNDLTTDKFNNKISDINQVYEKDDNISVIGIDCMIE